MNDKIEYKHYPKVPITPIDKLPKVKTRRPETTPADIRKIINKIDPEGKYAPDQETT